MTAPSLPGPLRLPWPGPLGILRVIREYRRALEENRAAFERALGADRSGKEK